MKKVVLVLFIVSFLHFVGISFPLKKRLYETHTAIFPKINTLAGLPTHACSAPFIVHNQNTAKQRGHECAVGIIEARRE